MSVKGILSSCLKVKADAVLRQASGGEEEREKAPHYKPGSQRRKCSLSTKIFLVFVGLLLSTALLPHRKEIMPSQQTISFARGGVYRSQGYDRICDHPADVFKAFRLPLDKVPSQEVLKKLPPPGTHAAVEPAITYAPQQDRLCTDDWTVLYARYVQPTPLATSAHTVITPTSGSSGAPGGFDSSHWVAGILKGLWSLAAQGFAKFLQDTIDWAKGFDIIFHTPESLTYEHRVVINLYQWVLGVLDGVVVIALMIGGYNYMMGRYRDFREVAATAICIAIAANFSLSLIGSIIDVHNELCLGVVGTVKTLGLGDLSFPWGAVNWANVSLYEGFAYLTELVFGLLLSLEMLLRITLLDLLIVLAPLGLYCFALPQMRMWGSLWAQAFASTLLLQFFQILCISMGSAMVGTTSGPFNISFVPELLGIASLFLAFRLPDMLLSHVIRAGVGAASQSMSSAIQTVAQYIAMVG